MFLKTDEIHRYKRVLNNIINQHYNYLLLLMTYQNHSSEHKEVDIARIIFAILKRFSKVIHRSVEPNYYNTKLILTI